MATRQQMFELAHALGHTDPAVFETPGGRFFATCSCGYQSTTRTSLRLAIEAGIHHALKEAKRAIASGVSVPPEGTIPL